MLSKTISSQPYTLTEYLKKLFRFSHLVKALTLRELKIKYSRTFFGIGWLFLQPLAVVLVYSIFFGYLLHLNSDNIAYPSFVFSGLVFWYMFTGIIHRSTNSLLESSELIHKVPFPRIIILVSKVVPAILESAILLILLFLVHIINHGHVGLNTLSALFYFVTVIVFSIALGLIFSLLAVKFRDVSQLIPIAMNFAIWLTPVFYPVSIIPQPYSAVVKIVNPIAGCIDGLRAAIFFDKAVPFSALVVFIFSLVLLLIAFYYFVKFEKNIVENL